jgi:hypothetical protein
MARWLTRRRKPLDTLMIRYPRRFCLLVLSGLILGSCGVSVKPDNLVPNVTARTLLPEQSPLRHAVSIAASNNSRIDKPVYGASISSMDIADALTQTLAAHDMLAESEGAYALSANVVNIDAPIGGLDYKVTATLRYTLTRIKDNAVIMDEAVTSAYTAAYGDAFMGNERERLAYEGAIRANLATFMEKLVAAFHKPPH